MMMWPRSRYGRVITLRSSRSVAGLSLQNDMPFNWIVMMISSLVLPLVIWETRGQCLSRKRMSIVTATSTSKCSPEPMQTGRSSCCSPLTPSLKPLEPMDSPTATQIAQGARPQNAVKNAARACPSAKPIAVMSVDTPASRTEAGNKASTHVSIAICAQ